MKKRRLFAVGILTGLLLMLPAAKVVLAQDASPEVQNDQGPPQDMQGPGPDNQAPAQDPPGRVAQLSYSSGSVSFQPNGQGDWVQAVTNRPLTAGDNLWADKDSRAELHIGSTAIRMDSETSITFLDLDDHTTQIKLSMGSLIVRVRHLDDGDTFEIDTPNLAYNIQRTGEYRLDVNSDGNLTDVTVWQGRGEATGGGESYLVLAGQEARFSGMINWIMKSPSCQGRMILMAGPRAGMKPRTEARAPIMSLKKSLDTRTSMPTEAGAIKPAMARFGLR